MHVRVQVRQHVCVTQPGRMPRFCCSGVYVCETKFARTCTWHIVVIRAASAPCVCVCVWLLLLRAAAALAAVGLRAYAEQSRGVCCCLLQDVLSGVVCAHLWLQSNARLLGISNDTDDSLCVPYYGTYIACEGLQNVCWCFSMQLVCLHGGRGRGQQNRPLTGAS
jgi:hypothetical protein